MATIIAKDNKQRLFEMMGRVDKNFKKVLNENITNLSDQSDEKHSIRKISQEEAFDLFNKGIFIYIKADSGQLESSRNLFLLNNRIKDGSLNLYLGQQTPAEYGFENIINWINERTNFPLEFYTLDSYLPHIISADNPDINFDSIQENTNTIDEAKTDDPTKEEMVNFLKNKFSGYGGEISDFDIEAAIYWFGYGYHGGQWSNLYSALSTSQYKPGRMHNKIEDEGSEIATDMYNALVDEYGGGQTTNTIDESKEDLVEYDIPTWALGALINGDYFGLNDEEVAKLNEFTKRVASEFGNAHFIMDDIEGEDDLGFKWRNDIDNMSGDVVRLYINPSNQQNTIDEGRPAGINRKYTHFALLKLNKKILNGWDYKGYDPEDLKMDKKHYFFQDIIDMDINPKLVEIQTRKNLERKGINPFDTNNWFKFEAEGWRDKPDELHEENTTDGNDPNYQIGELQFMLNDKLKQVQNLLELLNQNPPIEKIKGFVQGLLNNWETV